ncbi:DNA polymerase III subunit epsilon [Candidatus Albibeggiatoa sp. nov. NOAA]|uniref:DNA polymerase III subunit epsilon n=1 Tax=Candidatus Albibeggiatoa sp. nov. NOAA TaxID=3162724 RepID=UPI0032FABE22|nr:DNA polymerase III subunit epsilon [Thiotrichaceae bacterium]
MRQIVLDTETTGLEPKEGHKIIEIGCVEVINRRMTDSHFHQYLQPDRKIDEEAIQVHGITNEMLKDKPRFVDIVHEFMDFIQGAELLIHNAPFDVGFINYELQLLNQNWQPLEDYCTITDTLRMARKRYPGQKNNLDALCKRLDIDNSKRELHGALLDSQILADVYLAMTGGQVSLLGNDDTGLMAEADQIRRVNIEAGQLPLVTATEEELNLHQQYLDRLDKAVGDPCLWRSLETGHTA